jgi:hypothetical protein
MANRLAWFYMTGEWPADLVDHKNRARDDDRWENLRPATNAMNSQNQGMYKNNTSGFIGVSFHRGRWRAHIRVNYKLIILGYYDTAEAAGAAYLEAKAVHHPFAASALGAGKPLIILPN